MDSINLLAVLVAAITNIALGMYWYSPAGFSKQWIHDAGLDEEKMKKGGQKMMMAAMFFGLLTSLIMSYVLAITLQAFGVETITEALQVAVMMWLGFIATVGFGVVIWEMKPVRLFIITSGFWLISLGIMSAILTVWR